MEHNEAYLKTYSDIISINPVLSREEEESLFKDMRKFKSGKMRQTTREKIINSNIRLVVKEASYSSRHSIIPLEDLIGAGIEGLCIAIDKFNPRRYKTKLSTYAIPWIKLKIFRFIENASSNIHIPRHVQAQSRKYRRKAQNAIDTDEALTDKELMEELNVTERGLYNIRMAQAHIVSLNSNRYIDESGNETTMESRIPDNNSITADVLMEAEEKTQKLVKEVAKLKPIAAEIITRRYLSEVKEDLREVGKSLGLTGERVRQIEFKGLKILRKRMKNRSFFGI